MLKTHWNRAVETLTLPFFLALLLAAGFMGFVAWDHSHWWANREDYGFGWLVPAFVAFVVHDRWSRITAAVTVCAAPASPRAAGWKRWLLNFVIYGGMLGGALLFLLGAFYRAGAGPSHPGSLALSMGAGAIALTLFFVNAPDAESSRPSGIFDDARVRLTALLLFPALVWLVSAPMVSVIENQLSLFLLHKVTTVVFFVFDVLGLPLQQEGNVLVLPPLADGEPNRVGVEQACSGIRSLTACLFAGSFLAAVFLDKLWKKVALVAAAMAFAFLTNLIRSLFLTSWAYNYGHEAIEGTVHDVAGYSVLGLTVVGLLLLLPLFQLEWATGTDDEEEL
ncbi:exosortase/archaeosortase family protein [Synoicihabitans lomoniglobus]|uniref:Exosortase/archaeosortase family protein n=1 Tax=Synoicihabitans lomoniglobus TaxID=2909285 RepID=A0AAF0I6I2_9BACT|nr:exosortase/archaeosortase family protein [Opitutaceae bacterium LMO-M01]WED66106.1 exosortase/archaeosortase family protein [Opitutaceae bacterium LMO-M01]